jgi:hypothetical protein
MIKTERFKSAIYFADLQSKLDNNALILYMIYSLHFPWIIFMTM